MVVNSQMRQEGFNFRATHGVGMSLAVKKDKAPDPKHISLLGAKGVVLDPKNFADPIEELGRTWGRYRIRGRR
jgi:hypothetical protein